ncbi:hypothetical protein HMPREF9946_02219 [Acetobacteraceae bacterium AT-5844]|nr:hypothetical protein HMPREF9946_02219 [Acetobacteraceae bacterium AT-5844]
MTANVTAVITATEAPGCLIKSQQVLKSGRKRADLFSMNDTSTPACHSRAR